MTRVLIIQGAGMDERGRTMVEIFGPQTLPEINADIEAHARELGAEVQIYQTNDEATLVSRLRSLDPAGIDALIINPGGFTTSSGPLPDAIRALPFPAYEVHASNPAARGITSRIGPACRGSVCGFGYLGYRLALEAIVHGG